MAGDEATPTPEGSTTPSSEINRNNDNNRNNNNNNNNNNRRSNYKGSRKDQNLAILSIGDVNFKGADEDFGIVLGLPSEQPSLKHGKIYSEFASDLLTFVQSNYKRGNDLRPLIHDLSDPLPTIKNMQPPYPPGNVSKYEEKEWEIKVKRHLDRIDLLETNTEKLFGLLSGQCTAGLIAEIKADKGYEAGAKSTDALWLIKTMKSIAAGVDSKQDEAYTFIEKMGELMRLKQGPIESLDDYRTKFESGVKVLEMAGGDNIFLP